MSPTTANVSDRCSLPTFAIDQYADILKTWHK